MDENLMLVSNPPRWAIIAAGNRAGDRSVVNAQPAALVNRFVRIDFEVDLEDQLPEYLARKLVGDL